MMDFTGPNFKDTGRRAPFEAKAVCTAGIDMRLLVGMVG